MAVHSRFLADEEPRLATLAARKAFDGLSDSDKKYAYYMSRAGWAGASIISEQWTPFGVDLYRFLIILFSDKSGKKLASFEELQKTSGLADNDFQALLAFSGLALSNLSNYRSFGNSKFLPRLSAEHFEKVVNLCQNKEEAAKLWEKLQGNIYATTPEGLLQVGDPSKGHLSNYFPTAKDVSPPTADEVKAVQAICDANKVSLVNTRLRKNAENDFDVLIASVDKKTVTAKNDHESLSVKFVYGDFSTQLQNAVSHLEQAIKYAGADKRKQIIEKYIESYKTGSIEAHEKASEIWVGDIGPPVETYQGFIEAYVDPFMARAEWEGFVACINKEESKRFNVLVDSAEELIKLFPWPNDFELPKYQRPDYTSIDILSFATGEIPAGINLPNFQKIREIGFKNVSLSNVLSIPPRKEDIKFLSDADRDLMADWVQRSFAVNVAIHELLGHGSGRLLQETEDGKFNFDKDYLKNPLDGKPITSWYKDGQTPGSVIGSVYGSFEEMKAETCAIYLCGNAKILEIFGHTSKEETETIQYMVYLTFCHAGLRALELYDPKSSKHGQAHMQARFGIAKWLIDHKIAKWNIRYAGDKVSSIEIEVDKSAVLGGRGKKAIGELLLTLQVLKSTADAQGATEFYNRITAVPEEWSGKVRDYVLEQKTPRRIVIQPNMVEKNGTIELVEYEATLQGLIQSYVERQID